jgi:hypothetical protein
MRRSKPVAEKIGLQFDWNCAISLRALDGANCLDPHRYISQYADWDVHARMPHGIKAIEHHLKEVDNVPLLVSLFTDATTKTTRQMIDIFRDNGEVVLCVGSSCRLQNSGIFRASDLPVAVATLPGDQRQIPVSVADLVARFPSAGDLVPLIEATQAAPAVQPADAAVIAVASALNQRLCREDLILHFRLVGLGSAPLLQLPPSLAAEDHQRRARRAAATAGTSAAAAATAAAASAAGGKAAGSSSSAAADGAADDADHVRLCTLLEGVHMGRVLTLNVIQAGAFVCVCCLSMALWPLLAHALPLSVPPSLPPPLAALFLFVHMPIICLALLFGPGPDGVLKATPRKNVKRALVYGITDEDKKELSVSERLVLAQQKQRKAKDEARFFSYLLLRCAAVALSVFVTGWLACRCAFPAPPAAVPDDVAWTGVHGVWRRVAGMVHYTDVDLGTAADGGDRAAYWLVQDMMSVALLLALLAQSTTLVERGATLDSWPSPSLHPHYYGALWTSVMLHSAVVIARACMRGAPRAPAPAPAQICDVNAYGGYARLFWAEPSCAYYYTTFPPSTATATVATTGNDDPFVGLQAYADLGWGVWLTAAVAMPLFGAAVSVAVNQNDDRFYRRYLQFLRLEFDTRLGMHSPR